MKELPKAYNHKEVEDDIYQRWERSGFFNPDNLTGKPYTIIMPPPNVTGTLHMGHALMTTIEDILIRFERMRGRKTLWLPGTDHAAIATQVKVEKLLEKEEGKRKSDLGREEFLKRVEKFAQESHDTIIKQLKSMGASADWSREAFTLDEKRSLAVRTAFKKLYDKKLIYRAYRVVNWDVKAQTTISDDEIVYVERPAKLYTLKYSKDFPIAISTTRPETKVGDTAVAVHPKDNRYKKFIGQELDVEFAGVPLHLKIIADESVDKNFGTGALGVTPAHSMTDFEIAQRHKLELKQVIDERGRMTVGGENLLGGKTEEARAMIVEWLRSAGLLQKEEDITQNVATAERTGGVIEPLPKLQWFIDVSTLKKPMREVVESGKIKIIPEHFSKIYFHWIDNLRDWCISRQIWYGHRIPVWYKGDKIYCDVSAPQGEAWEQDPDTLDTWFSSGLWTFSTLGWPEQTNDLKTFHPTDVLETGYDILFFWVARMILLTQVLLKDIPFKTVFLHGIIRDAEKKKMSKSKGNVIDPLEMTEKYGTDALRFALVFNTAPGTDMAMAEDKIKGMKHFANKLWNIARFILQNSDKIYSEKELAGIKDKKLGEIVKEVESNLEKFKLHEAAQAIYDFTWHEFADKTIEEAKPLLADPKQKDATQKQLQYSLRTILKLLHPFMPFVTEHIWSHLSDDLLMIQKFPQTKKSSLQG